MWSAQTLFQWIDLLWLPVAAVAVHKGQRLTAVFFVLCCALIVRLQIELMVDIGYPTGILPWMNSTLYSRGIVTYSLFIAVFLLLSRYSPKINMFVYMASAFSIFFVAFCVSTALMLL